MPRIALRVLLHTAVALFLFAPPLARAQQPPSLPSLDFGAAWRQLLSSHETLQAIDKEQRQREEERAATRSLYWPKVDANARYTRIDDPINIDLSPIRQVILSLHPQVPSSRVPAFLEHVQDEQFWRADLRVTWPIFTGGKVTAANRAAEAQVADVEAQRKLAQEALATDLVKRYFGLRLALSGLAVRTEVLAGLDQHLREARRLEEEGLISRAERLHAEVARSDADRQLKRVEQDVEIARAGLANILSAATVGDPATPLFLVPALEPLDRFKQEAEAKHPAFAKFAAQRTLATQALRAQQGRRLPDVYLFGMRELHEDDLTLLDPKWAAGIGASLTLFDGFDRKHRTAAAKLQQKRVDDLEQRARRDILTLVEKRYREVAKARQQFDALQPAIELGRENLRVRSRAFEEGMATSMEVVDARLALSRVEMERLSAAYDFDVALADLLEASGQAERFEAFAAQGAPVQVSSPAVHSVKHTNDQARH
jgi:outer membrane protein TolC